MVLEWVAIGLTAIGNLAAILTLYWKLIRDRSEQQAAMIEEAKQVASQQVSASRDMEAQRDRLAVLERVVNDENHGNLALFAAHNTHYSVIGERLGQIFSSIEKLHADHKSLMQFLLGKRGDP